MILRPFFVLLFLWLCVIIKAQEGEETKNQKNSTETSTTTTTSVATEDPGREKTNNERIKFMISKMSDDLAINHPLNLSQPHCRDFWGRAGVSLNGSCIYIQVVQMTRDENNAINSTQYLNLNPYSPSMFEDPFFSMYSREDNVHFANIVDECNEMYDPDQMNKIATWKTSPKNQSITIDLMVVHCCRSEKANGCFKDPQTKEEALVFPQCFNEVVDVELKKPWTTYIHRIIKTSAGPLERVKTCNFYAYLDSDDKIKDRDVSGFLNPYCNALDLERTCYMGLKRKENTAGFYRLWCCQKFALNTTELPDKQAYGSVYSPLAEMMLDMITSQGKMGHDGLCAGGVDTDNKLCFFNFDLTDFPKPIYTEPDFEDSVLPISVKSYNCSIVWTKSTSMVPVFRCICSYEVKKMCDEGVLKDFNAFSEKIKGHMMQKTHCDQPASEKITDIVVGCKILMDIKNNYIAIHPSQVYGNDYMFMLNSNIETGRCRYLEDNETITCFCRANYTGNDFCNTIGNFQEEYQSLVTILQTRSNFKNLVTRYHTDCLKNFKKLSVDLRSKFIGSTSRILCYSSNFGPQKEKDTEYYDQNEEKGSEETGVYLPGQVNENIKIIPRIACDMFFDETLNSDLVDGCKCLISTSDILKKKPLYCCCQPNKIQ